MTTTTVYAADDGYVNGTNATYSTARSAGGGALDNVDADVGQSYEFSTYYVWQGLYSFETADALADDEVVSQVDLMTWLVTDQSTTNFVAQARTHDWGDPTVEAGDWVAGADLSSKTLLATLDSNGIGSTGAYKTWTSEGSAFDSAIAVTGTTDNTEMVLCSAEQVNNSAPTGKEHLIFDSVATAGTTQDPKLVVTSSASVSATVTQTAIVTTASLPAPTVVANSTVTPAAIATSVTVPAVTVTAGADRTPDTITATVTVPAATAITATNATVTPDAIVAAATLPAVTVNADALVAPATIATTVTLPQADTVESTPLTIAMVVAVPQVTVTADATVTPAAITATVTVPQVAAGQGSISLPDSIVTTVALPAATVNADALVAPATIAATVALPAVDVLTVTVVSPDTIAATVALPAATITADATVTPDTISLTVTVPAITLELTSSGTGSPATIAATVSIPQATVEITYTWTFSPPTTADTARYRLEDGAPIRDLFRHVAGHAQGITVMKLNGAYVESTSPYQDDLLAAERVYYGGHVNPISEEEAADLTAAGYGAYLVSS